ncbi:MAG: hypothetical protein LUE98_05170 [Tannerellaceae bacterium]|nr:hypothetical protein [Tannerellaceae bacterium]
MAIKTPEIQSITILEGDQELTVPEIAQYVNLPRDSQYVNPAYNIPHIDRLGRKIRCKVSFNTVGKFKFKVKLNPDSSNVVYTATEKSRNSNYCYSEGEIEFTTDSTGEKIIEADKLFVTPASNDLFTISAQYNSGTAKEATTKIRTKKDDFL